MSTILEELATIYSDHVWLEVSPQQIEKTWFAEHDYSYYVARWTAFKNRLTLDAFLVWIKEESGIDKQADLWPSIEDLPSIWEVVNGTAVQIGKTRIILIPNDETDIDEFCVPAEWVDIPSWAGDYYLAVQVNIDGPNGGWLRFWGYTTHKKLKQAGQFDKIRRTYSLEREELIEDLNVMWVARKFDGDEKAPVESLPNLSAAEAEELLKQLGQPSCYSPRFKVDFEKWGALIGNRTWRRELYQRRVMPQPPVKPALELWRCLQNDFVEAAQAGWQKFEEVFGTTYENFYGLRGIRGLSYNREAYRDSPGSPKHAASVKLAKPIDLGVKTTKLSLALVTVLTQEVNQQIRFRIQLSPIIKSQAGGTGSRNLPEGLKLIFTDESGKIFQDVAAGSGDRIIQTKLFSGEPGDRFTVKIVLRNACLTERFII